MFTSLFVPEISILEKIIRPLVVYIFLIIAFRIVGKRELGSMTPFDLIILLTVSNVLQNAMIGPDNSLTGGIIGAMTMFAANTLFAELNFRYRWFERLIQGHATVLIENGKIIQKNLDHELLTQEDLRHALLKNQIDPDTDLPTIRRAELESDGSITITRTGFQSDQLIQRRRGKTKKED